MAGLEFPGRYLSEADGAAVRTEKWLLGRFLMSPCIPDPDFDGADVVPKCVSSATLFTVGCRYASAFNGCFRHEVLVAAA